MGFLNRLRAFAVLALIAVSVSACGYNVIPTKQEAANAAWAEVQNQYQRRADLVPNLVATVQGFAKQEKDVFVQVTEARAKATSIHLDANDLTDPAKVKALQDAQNALSGALGRLLAVSENYPELKSNANFLALQSQLEGTENRIAVARRDYIASVQDFNTTLQDLPERALGADGVPLDQAAGSVHRRFRSPGGAEGEVLTRQRESLHARLRPRASFVWPQALVVALLAALWASAALAAANFPPLTGRVVDQANILSPVTKADLERKLADLEQKSRIQLVVATVPSLDGEEIEPYANGLFRAWKLGEAKDNNGALLLIAPKERRVRIEVGYGLEGTLTDAVSSIIISNAIAPRFKAGDFNGGVTRGVDDIITDALDRLGRVEAEADRYARGT